VVEAGLVFGPTRGPRTFVLHGTQGSFEKSSGLDNQEALLRMAGGAPHCEGWGREAEKDFGTLMHFEKNNETETFPSLPGDYTVYYRDIAAAILDESPESVPVTAASAKQVIQIIEAAEESAKTGQTVKLSALV
jgi:scyllo-inositol 2-dehydrogenase (NADP+)